MVPEDSYMFAQSEGFNRLGVRDARRFGPSLTNVQRLESRAGNRCAYGIVVSLGLLTAVQGFPVAP